VHNVHFCTSSSLDQYNTYSIIRLINHMEELLLQWTLVLVSLLLHCSTRRHGEGMSSAIGSSPAKNSNGFGGMQMLMQGQVNN